MYLALQDLSQQCVVVAVACFLSLTTRKWPGSLHAKYVVCPELWPLSEYKKVATNFTYFCLICGAVSWKISLAKKHL